MLLNRIDDPRDNLEKAHRLELVKFAHAQGVTEITEHMPAILIRRMLRAKGLTNIRIPPRALGQQAGTSAPNGSQQEVPSIDAADDLARQFAAEQAAARHAGKLAREPIRKRLVERPKSEINKLRDICKERGIKMERRDRMPDLKAKIEAHSGKNAT